MNTRCRQLLAGLVLIIAMTLSFSGAVFASDDNSLADLGIRTEGAIVSPEFKYDIWEYNVEVPAGTKELTLEPHTTNPTASVDSISGTTLNEDGTGTVVITVTSESGNAIEYVLNITPARGQVDPAEAIAANEGTTPAAMMELETEVKQSEVQTEDQRYVKVDRNSLQDAENTIEKLQKTITEQRNQMSMLTYVLYALIAVSILFLFIVISLLLRRRDMAQELHMYREGDLYGMKDEQVPSDGWGEWGEEEESGSRKKKRSKKQPEEDDWDDQPVNAATSWSETQVGTPVAPRRSPKEGGAQYSHRNVNQRSNANQRSGGNENGNGNGNGRTKGRAKGSGASAGNASARGASAKGSRGNAGAQNASAQKDQTRTSDSTKLYRNVQPVHPQDVPKDVTRDLSKMNKAEAKAIRKAAAAEAKRAQEMERAQKARNEEARRQAEEAKRIAQQQEQARLAQEEALKKAADEQAALEAQRLAENAAKNGAKGAAPTQPGGGSVKVDVIDL